MATANDIIKGGFSKAGIRAAETPLTSDELADALVLLNDMGNELEESTISLGFQTLTNAADEVRIPRGAVNFYKARMAVMLCSEYTRPVPPLLVGELEVSFNNVLIANRPKMATSMPDTLPMGSGNDGDDLLTDKFFYEEKKVNY